MDDLFQLFGLDVLISHKRDFLDITSFPFINREMNCRLVSFQYFYSIVDLGVVKPLVCIFRLQLFNGLSNLIGIQNSIL